MFLPDSNHKDDKEERKAACIRVEEMALEQVPEELRENLQISVQEVQCGDPNCAPIDTAITLIFNSGGGGMVGIPMEAKDVTSEEIEVVMPPANILQKWHKGEEAEWPPDPYGEQNGPPALPQLRFEVGQKVLCRVGANDWGPGTITQLWYREQHWPQNSWAPYKIRLDSGKDIFAPGDLEQIIKANPNP